MIWLLAISCFAVGAGVGVLVSSFIERNFGVFEREKWEDMDLVAREYGWEVREPEDIVNEHISPEYIKALLDSTPERLQHLIGEYTAESGPPHVTWCIDGVPKSED